MHAIVHIGQPKAGSTAIQMGLWAERENLKAQGILVGPLDRDLSLALHETDVIKKIPMLRIKFGTMAAARAHSEKQWENFSNTVRKIRPELTLLSSEHLMGVSGRLMERLQPLFDRISIVCYVRDPVSRYVSELDQSIRGGSIFPNLDVSGKIIARAADFVRSYRTIAGAENLTVRNFDRSNLKDGDVVTDFFEQVSLLTGWPVVPQKPPRRNNESLCGAATVWMLTLNSTFRRQTADPASVKLRQSLIAHLREAETLKDLPRLKLTDPVLIDSVRSGVAEDCEWLNKTVLQGQVPLDVGNPKPTTAPDPAELRARMQDWLLSYLTPEATALVARAMMDHRPAFAYAGGKGKAPKIGANAAVRG